MGEKVKYILYMALLKPLAWLPFCVLYAISDFLYLIFYRICHYRIKVVRENIRASFPDKQEEEQLDIERKFYHQLCDNIVESIKLLHFPDKSVDRHIEVVGGHLVEEIALRGNPVFLYLGHFCNWEWVPAITRHFSIPKVCAQIYKPLRDKTFDRVMLRLRSRFHPLNIPQDKALRTLFSLSREGSFIVGILDDHSPNHGRSHHYMEFLNHPGTIINVGAEEIGRRVGAEYLYLDIEKIRRGHYLLTFKPLVIEHEWEDYPVSHEYMRMLETTIRRQAPYWLWSHKRWRYTAAPEEIKNSNIP